DLSAIFVEDYADPALLSALPRHVIADFFKSFRQCTISLLIIHTAIIRGRMEKLPDIITSVA
ncbi:MAG: hypothetical protein PVG40_13080, partial [Desulfobacterales bacterium]